MKSKHILPTISTPSDSQYWQSFADLSNMQKLFKTNMVLLLYMRHFPIDHCLIGIFQEDVRFIILSL